MAKHPHRDVAGPEFAERLRQAIHRLGVEPHEQSRLGDLFGVTGQAARKWVQGLNMPSRDNIAHIAKALGVRRAWLEYGEGPMYPEVGVAEPGAMYDSGEQLVLDAREIRLLYAYRSLSVSTRAALEQIIEELGEGHRAGPSADDS